MKNNKNGRIIQEMQEIISDLYLAGVITKKSMIEFEALKNLDVKPTNPTRIKLFRTKTRADL